MDKARQRATMADMRILSKAIEAYREDSSAIPTDDGGITALVTVLSPDDSLLLPTRDHWSHTYTYVSDGAGNYTIESHGKDGADGPNITLGSRFDFDLDIVLSNGVFVAAPE
jgi:type II secretory pathway pseudopilin PulG